MNAFLEWRKHHIMKFDTACTAILVAVITASAHLTWTTYQLTNALEGIRTTLYGSAFAGCAALLGFILTAAALTDAVVQNPRWDAFRTKLAYSELRSIYFNVIRWLGVSSLLFLTFLIVDTDAHPQDVCEVISLWLVLTVVWHLRRSIDAFELILKTNAKLPS